MLAVLVIAGSITGFSLFTKNKPTAAHATSTAPTLTLATKNFRPWQEDIKVVAKGFAPNEGVWLYFDTVTDTDDPPGGMSCDSNGTCPDQFSTVGRNLIEGPHKLIAVGKTSGLRAEAVFNAIPDIRIYPKTVGLINKFSMDGAFFAGNETVHVYWGHHLKVCCLEQ